LLVHIGDPQKNQAASLESQTTPTIQYVLGQALSNHKDLDAAKRVAQRAFRLGGCRSVAVIKIGDKPEGQIIDIFDGEWLSSRDWWEEAAI
jgi:hypothetical protein